MNELIAILILALVGALLIGTGIYLLAGLAWTLIAAGCAFIAAAAVIRRGYYRA